MANIGTKDLTRRSNLNRFLTAPECDIVDTTGCVIGPLAIGRYVVKSSVDCYWLRGASTLAVTDVLVDESTPSVSNQFFGGDAYEIDVTGSSDNYIAFKSPTGGMTGIITVEYRALDGE